MVILLVEIHTIRKHSFYITNFHRHIRRHHAAVYFHISRISIVEAPYPQVSYQVVESTPSLEVHRLILLNRYNWKPNQVWSTHNVTLHFHKIWKSSLIMVVNFGASYSDFFFSNGMRNIPWPNERVFTFSYSKRCFPLHY